MRGKNYGTRIFILSLVALILSLAVLALRVVLFFT